MLHVINNVRLIDARTEAHYRIHTQIDSSQYPQVHDFYEFVLVTSGTLTLQIGERRYALQPGNLVLIRPGDIHTKSGKESAHINLAFPTTAIDALFEYLCNEQALEHPRDLAYISPVLLKGPEFLALQERMRLLNAIPAGEHERIKATLRSLLFEVITRYYLPPLSTGQAEEAVPRWLSDALVKWQTEGGRNQGLEYFCENTGYSKEHICRTFKCCFGMTSTEYLNRQRLNWAINLLLHSDYSVTDIAYESGFCSPSRFYHAFREAYGMSPKQFYHECMQTNCEVFGRKPYSSF